MKGIMSCNLTGIEFHGAEYVVPLSEQTCRRGRSDLCVRNIEGHARREHIQIHFARAAELSDTQRVDALICGK